MLTKVLEGLGVKLADQWLSQALTQAFVFWAGGAIVWGWHNGFVQVFTWLASIDLVQGGALLVATLVLVAVSGTIIQSLVQPLLRLLEGYWPWPFKRLGGVLACWLAVRLQKAEFRRSGLSARNPAELSYIERRTLAELEMHLHYTPADPADFMPTTLGNILRSAETGPTGKYGLDAVICWPRLWLLLPEATRKELEGSRQALNQSVAAWAWGLLFILWTFWAWWALPVGLLVTWGAYHSALIAAQVYTDLVEAAFDLYRWDLYQALHLSPPNDSTQGFEYGRAITKYLWRGE